MRVLIPRCADLSGWGKIREASEIFAKEGIVFSYSIRILQQGSVDYVPFGFWVDILRLRTRRVVVFVSARREKNPGFF